MNRKIRVGIIFGGRSAEHEVSLLSARSIIQAIDRDKYDLTYIGIDKTGNWRLYENEDFLIYPEDPKKVRLVESGQKLAIIPGKDRDQLINLSNFRIIDHLDVVFPVLHGPFGEDGTTQGALKLAGIPFVGPGVLGSAASMDKDVAKRLMTQAGILNAKFMAFHRHQLETIDFQEVREKLGLPVFIKPANMGSSVGVNKADSEERFFAHLKHAFEFDDKAVVEEYIKGREIECSVLGNERPAASLPGEIVASHDFYSYEAKYIDDKGAILQIPASLPEKIISQVKEIALQTFKVLCCEGLSRVDMFLTEDEKIYVNEVNTLPGFTKISMYPKLWEQSGISYSELIDRLLQLAIERHERENKLKTSLN